MSPDDRGPDPTVHRRRLRNELRKAREAAGFTQRDTALAMDWSPSKLIRIETGGVSISTNDLRALAAHYGIDDPARVQELLDLARKARERSPWAAYRELSSPEYVAFLAYESTASVIRNFEPLLIPGLLQTEEYAREVIGEFEGPDKRTVDELVDLRMERQELLNRPDPPGLHFILDQAVITRLVGGPEVMRRQLRHLKEMAHRDRVTIRIVPFSYGMYPRLRVPYVLFEFPDPQDEDVLYIENPQGEMIVREASSLDDESGVTPVIYLEVFFQLEQIARREEAPRLIDAALAALPRVPQPELLSSSQAELGEATA
jgi:transcriptional regulator with XRE-family HTH domain